MATGPPRCTSPHRRGTLLVWNGWSAKPVPIQQPEPLMACAQSTRQHRPGRQRACEQCSTGGLWTLASCATAKVQLRSILRRARGKFRLWNVFSGREEPPATSKTTLGRRRCTMPQSRGS